MSDSVLMLTKALDFAARRHAHQRRKGATAEPYVNHVIAVAHLLAEVTEGRDAELVAAGLLHDTVEDTDTTLDELSQAFGADIADLVAQVTDDKSLPKAERKRLQIEKAPGKSERAKMLKLADKVCNLKSLRESPPEDWDDARRRDYFDWAKRVADGCRGVNGFLEQAFDRAWQAGTERYAEPTEP